MVIFFDLDDTLIDSQRAVDWAVATVHSDLRVDQPLADFLAAWRKSHSNHYPRYLNGKISYESLRRSRIREVLGTHLSDAEADSIFESYMNAYESKWALFADVEPCLEGLRTHCLGVISNGPSQEQRRKLARLGIEPRFQHILISEECKCAKPDPGIFGRACELAGVTPSDAWYVGDHYEIDFCGSIAAGLRGIWLNRRGGVCESSELKVISSLAQVAEAISSG